MSNLAYLGLALLLVSVPLLAAPQVSKQDGLYILENDLLRAEVKYSELYRVTYKPTGHELMSPGWHGVINLCGKSPVPGKEEPTWLFQDSLGRNRKYEIAAPADQATLIVNFDWVARPGDQPPYYAVEQKLTIFDDKPYLRVRYHIVAKQPPDPPPASFMVQSSGTQGTHFIEPDGQLRVEALGEARLAGMRTDPNSYWFAFWDRPTGHYTAFLRPGQTDPTRCMFYKASWYVSRWAEPFLGKPGQTHAEELWIIAGRIDGDDPAPIAQAAQSGYAFAESHQPIMATLQSPFVTHEELVAQSKHLRADGKGDHIVFKNERLYVDGKPFLLFAPWGAIRDWFATQKKYHLTGIFGGIGSADAAAEHGLKFVPSALEWPKKRGQELEEHIRNYVDHPAIIAWFLQDDFAGDLSMLANIEQIRKVDTHRPTVADVVGYDASRRRASAFVDICSPYTYPAPIHTYHWYADYLEHDQRIMDRQFNWTCPQARSYSHFAVTGQSTDYYIEYPTAAQMRLQTYLGLAHGIRGFMYWPVGGLVDYKLSELGILCLEVEPLTDLIVEADKNCAAASADNDQIEVQRIDWGRHTLLFLLNYRDKSERWPTGEPARKFRVTVKAMPPEAKPYSMTFDQDLQIARPRRSGEDLQFEVSGLDVAAMVLVTADAAYAADLQRACDQREPEAIEFATTTNQYMAGKVHGLLSKLAGMNAPLGRGPELYNQAVARLASEATFTGQRQVARLLRQALGEALAQADALADYAPRYAQNSLLINVWKLPQFMASFNFPMLKTGAAAKLDPPPAIDPMFSSDPPEPAKPIEVGTIVTGGEGRGSQGYAADLQADSTYCVFLHSGGRALPLYADEAAYLAGASDFVGLPNDNLALTVSLCRPAAPLQLHFAVPNSATAFGLVAAQPMAIGQELTGPELAAESPVAVYELPAKKGDSFEVTMQAAPGCRFDLVLCQAHSRYGQVLTSSRSDGQQPLALRGTLPDEGPLTVVVERYQGEGGFTLAAAALAEQVLPQRAVNPFAGVKFALYGKDTSNFLAILAAHGIAGDHLSGKLVATDLSQYNALILLTNCVMYDETDELQANAAKLKQFVHDGGGLVLFQQNGRGTWDSTILPYPMELLIGSTTTAPVLADERLFTGVKPEEFVSGDRRVVYYPVKVAGTDGNWRYPAYADEDREQGAVAVCGYGQGRAIINQFAVLDRIGEPVMRSLMVETVQYVLHADDL